jgi:predicted small secreted protein
MNILRRKTYKWLRAQRDLLVNAKAFSIDEEDRAALQKAIQGLENEMYRHELVVVRLAVVVITALVLLSIVSGCISNTLDGMRQDIHNASRPGNQAKWVK